MEFAVEFGGEPQDVTVTASGVADVASLRELVSTVAGDERYRAGLLLLYELSGLDMSQLSDRELEHAIAHLGGSSSGRRLFTSRDDAVAWLATIRT